MADEYFEIYDAENRPCGRAPRRDCHGNPALRHRASQVMVFHPEDGRMLLQRRSRAKDIQPGRWDTAVGGHLQLGEEYPAAARREMAEELGVEPDALEFVMDLAIRNEIESEDLRVFKCRHAGPFRFQASEIDELRWFTRDELCDPRWRAEFTPNLLRELDTPGWEGASDDGK